jgi:hypothetical protein
VRFIYALPTGEIPSGFKTKQKQLMFVMKKAERVRIDRLVSSPAIPSIVPDIADPHRVGGAINLEDGAERVAEHDALFACPRFTRTDRVGCQYLIDKVGSLGDGLTLGRIALRPALRQIIDRTLKSDDPKFHSFSK